MRSSINGALLAIFAAAVVVLAVGVLELVPAYRPPHFTSRRRLALCFLLLVHLRLAVSSNSKLYLSCAKKVAFFFISLRLCRWQYAVYVYRIQYQATVEPACNLQQWHNAKDHRTQIVLMCVCVSASFNAAAVEYSPAIHVSHTISGKSIHFRFISYRFFFLVELLSFASFRYPALFFSLPSSHFIRLDGSRLIWNPIIYPLQTN